MVKNRNISLIILSLLLHHTFQSFRFLKKTVIFQQGFPLIDSVPSRNLKLFILTVQFVSPWQYTRLSVTENAEILDP